MPIASLELNNSCRKGKAMFWDVNTLYKDVDCRSRNYHKGQIPNDKKI